MEKANIILVHCVKNGNRELSDAETAQRQELQTATIQRKCSVFMKEQNRK
jgi:hypothetical protein